MAITFRANTQVDTSSIGSSISFGTPTGTVATDIMIVIIGAGNCSTSVGTYAPSSPASWTSIFSEFHVTATNTVGLAAWWGLGSVSNLTFNRTGTVGSVGGICASFTGVHNTTPIDAVGVGQTATGQNSITIPSITANFTNSVEIIAYGEWLNGTPSATGFTVLQNGSGGGLAANEVADLLYNLTALGGSSGSVSISDTASATGQLITACGFLLHDAAGGAAFTWQKLNAGEDGSTPILAARQIEHVQY